ncbi:MAG: cytochrome C [Desulfuromonadaceae bacterium]|nr:cytochrome C [Desulfuromonadaceae bacterium]
MKKLGFAVLAAIALCGCAMFTAWKAIPPPGGCDQCHTLPINANWTVAYTPATLSDESGRYSWQTEAAVLPEQESPMQQQKVSEEPCFRCHRGPSKAHTERVGRYHH